MPHRTLVRRRFERCFGAMSRTFGYLRGLPPPTGARPLACPMDCCRRTRFVRRERTVADTRFVFDGAHELFKCFRYSFVQRRVPFDRYRRRVPGCRFPAPFVTTGSRASSSHAVHRDIRRGQSHVPPRPQSTDAENRAKYGRLHASRAVSLIRLIIQRSDVCTVN